MNKFTKVYFFAAIAIVVLIVVLDLWNVFIQGDDGGTISGLAILLLAVVYMARKASRGDE